MPNSRPRIVFNEEGICNACLHSKKKEKINWNERKLEFLELVNKIKFDTKKIIVCMIV